ncbi:hypothetical protein K2P96_00755, partial [Patescibacteria group bacterium]|nr:hypothetical protein [Patescibacteria group bacterium]
MKSLQKKNAGVITLEILIAFAILILNITAVMLLLDGGQSLSVDSQTNTEAIAKAQNMLAQARSDAETDFDSVVSQTDTDGFYTRNLIVGVVPNDPTNEDKKLLTSTTSWQNGVRTLSVAFSTLITNYANLTDTCSATLSGDWKNPVMNPSSGYNFGSDIVGTSSNGFSITDIKAFGKKLLITVDAVPGSYHEDNMFFIVDSTKVLSGPSNSLLGAGDSTSPGLKAVTASGKYAYVASASINGQLQVIDISDTSNPVVVKTLKLTNVTGSGGQALGNSIFYSNKKIYLGLTKTSTGPEFNIIDVTNPLSPQFVGGYPIGNGVNKIYVKDNYAYIASPNTDNLIVLDVTNPGAIT